MGEKCRLDSEIKKRNLQLKLHKVKYKKKKNLKTEVYRVLLTAQNKGIKEGNNKHK